MHVLFPAGRRIHRNLLIHILQIEVPCCPVLSAVPDRRIVVSGRLALHPVIQHGGNRHLERDIDVPYIPCAEAKGRCQSAACAGPANEQLASVDPELLRVVFHPQKRFVAVLQCVRIGRLRRFGIIREHCDAAPVATEHVNQKALLFRHAKSKSAVMQPEKSGCFRPCPLFAPYNQEPQDRAVLAYDRLFFCDRISAFPLTAVFFDALPVIFLKCRRAGRCECQLHQPRSRSQF